MLQGYTVQKAGDTETKILLAGTQPRPHVAEHLLYTLRLPTSFAFGHLLFSLRWLWQIGGFLPLLVVVV